MVSFIILSLVVYFPIGVGGRGEVSMVEGVANKDSVSGILKVSYDMI